MLSDVGLGQNIVQSRRGDDPAFLDTAWVVQIVRGGVLWSVALLPSIALELLVLLALPAEFLCGSTLNLLSP